MFTVASSIPHLLSAPSVVPAFCLLRFRIPHSAFCLSPDFAETNRERTSWTTNLPRVTARLLTSYRHVGGINNIEVVNVPSKRAVGAMCEELLQLLFPGFPRRETDPLRRTPRAITERRVQKLTDRLGEEILKSLRTRLPGGCSRERAHEIVFSFLDELPTVRELLRTDVEAAYEGDPAASSLEEIIVVLPFLSRPSPSSGSRTSSTGWTCRSSRA